MFLIISSSKSKPYTQFPLNILSLPHPLFSSLIGPIPCLWPLLFIYATTPGGASQIHTSLSNSLGLNLSLSLSSIFMRWSFLSLLPLKPSLILRLVLIYGERIGWPWSSKWAVELLIFLDLELRYVEVDLSFIFLSSFSWVVVLLVSMKVDLDFINFFSTCKWVRIC